MLDWWMTLASKLSTNQIRRAFKILGLTKSNVLTPEDADWCLRALSKAPNFELELIYNKVVRPNLNKITESFKKMHQQ